MLDMLTQVRKTFNTELNLLGILITKFDIRTTLSTTTQEAIRDEGLPLLAPPIRVCVEIIRAQMERVPVSMLAPESSAAADYEALAENLLPTRVRRVPKQRPAKVVPLRRKGMNLSRLNVKCL